MHTDMKKKQEDFSQKQSDRICTVREITGFYIRSLCDDPVTQPRRDDGALVTEVLEAVTDLLHSKRIRVSYPVRVTEGKKVRVYDSELDIKLSSWKALLEPQRALAIDAFQWDGTHKSTVALKKWFKARHFEDEIVVGEHLDGSPTPALNLQHDECFHNGGEVLIMIPGEWIVYDSWDDYCILMSQEAFTEYCLPKAVKKGHL